MNNILSQSRTSPRTWRALDLEAELQAKPIETDNFDFLLSPLDKGLPKLQPKTVSNRSSLSKIGNNMMAFFNIKKFVQRIGRHRENFKNLNLKHLEVIADKASDEQLVLDGNKNKPKIKIFDFQLKLSHNLIDEKIIQLKKYIQDLIQKIPLIHPDSFRKVIWDYAMTILRIVFMVLIPLEIAFKPQIIFESGQSLTGIMIFLLIFDIFLRINTVFYKGGKAIHDRWEILISKLEQVALIDGLSITSLLINFIYSVPFLLLLYFLQFVFVYEVLKKSNENFYYSKTVQGMIKLVQFILILVGILHLFSCIWFEISVNTNDGNWVQMQGIENAVWSIQYVEALYFATVTMLTVGYGDSVPQNQTEKITTILFILGACLWYSYAVNTIGQIIEEIKQNSELRKIKMRIINGYMIKRQIPYSLKYRIREYLNYRWIQEEQKDLELENGLVNELSDELKNDLENIVRKRYIEKCEFLQRFSAEFRTSVSAHIKREIIQPQNNYSNNCLCFIEQGQLQYLQNEIQEGSFISIYEFLTDKQVSYKAIGYVSLLIIEKDIFLKVIKQYQKDHEIYCQIRDEIKFQNSNYMMQCRFCNTNSHLTQQCPLVNYIVDRECILKRHCYPIQQKRIFFTRKRTKNYFRAIDDNEMIVEYVSYFQSERTQLIQEQQKFQRNQELEQNKYSVENTPDEFQEFGPKRNSLLGNFNVSLANFNALAPPALTPNALTPRMGGIQFLGLAKSTKPSELERQFQLRQRDPNIFDSWQQSNISQLYSQMKNQNLVNVDLEILYLSQKSVELEGLDQLRQYQHYCVEQNANQVLRRNQPTYKSHFSELIRYMFYPFQYVMKYHKPELKRRTTGKFVKNANILKFKNLLLHKRIKSNQISPFDI